MFKDEKENPANFIRLLEWVVCDAYLCYMTVGLSTLNFRFDGKKAPHFIREWVTYYERKYYVSHDWTFTFWTASSPVAGGPLFSARALRSFPSYPSRVFRSSPALELLTPN